MNYLFSMQIRRFLAISLFFLQQFRPVAKGLPLQGSVNTIFSINGKKQTQDKTCVCFFDLNSYIPDIHMAAAPEAGPTPDRWR